jgi:phage-related protein
VNSLYLIFADVRRAAFETGDVGWNQPQRFARVPRTCTGSRGYALYIAQRGGKHRDAKPLSGFGGTGVVEIVKDYRSDTFRAVYTLRYAGMVFVLHAFQKKSKTGRETPRRDMELIKQRLREAEQIAKEMKP